MPLIEQVHAASSNADSYRSGIGTRVATRADRTRRDADNVNVSMIKRPLRRLADTYEATR